MSSKGTGKFIVSLADHTKFGPKIAVRVSKIETGKYRLSLHHPNKTVPVLNEKGEEIIDKRTGRKKLEGKILHEQIVENNNSDEMQAFLEVKALGDKMINPPYFDREANNGKGGHVGGEFYNMQTEYQEILFIPAMRKGRSKLNTKKAIQSGNEDGEVDLEYDENAEVSVGEISETDLNQDDFEIPEVNDSEKEQIVIVSKKKSLKAKVAKDIEKPKKKEKKIKALTKKVKNKVKNNKKSKVKAKKKNK